MKILLSSLQQTCDGCPSQWEARSRKGKAVYIRYRWGTLSVSVNDEGYVTTAPKGADPMAGVMATDDMVKLLEKRTSLRFVNE